MAQNEVRANIFSGFLTVFQSERVASAGGRKGVWGEFRPPYKFWAKSVRIFSKAHRQLGNVFVGSLQIQEAEIESKAENLLDLFIGGKGIEPEEYQAKKSKLINEKQDILEKIRDFEQKGNNWLEPMSEVLEAITEVIGLPTHPLSANSKYGIVAKWDLAEVNIDKLIILFEKLSSVTT